MFVKMILKFCVNTALLCAITSLIVVHAKPKKNCESNEQKAWDYMNNLSKVSGERMNRITLASWDYESNLTDYNQEKMLSVSLEVSKQNKETWENTIKFPYKEFKDESLKRMFEKYVIIGEAALPDDQNAKLLQAIADMQANYAKATICSYQNESKCDLYVEPEVTEIFASSHDAEELKHAWVEWYKNSGRINKENYIEYVTLKNEAAKLNGFEDAADWWIKVYEDPTIENQFLALWDQIRPLYEQVHAYVRRNLRNKYGGDVVSERGPIPAHLLGNIWAQTWSGVFDFSQPYPEMPDIDVAEALIKQNFTALKLFQMADDFFVSLNLSAVPQSFWDNSIIEKPDGVEMVCHASAWDFFDGKDFRIKQCTRLTTDFVRTTHHEMGHIQYYIQYKDQPTVYKEGANPGFHEAVGDVIALSVSTPKHLHAIGLLDELPTDDKSELNQQFKMILDKVVFLPFAYMLDLWRYGVFRGETTPDNYNCHFWALRDYLQGVEPPVTRTEDDFDAVAKYHVAADVEYMRYYISYVVQFQFHRALCALAGEYASGDVDKELSDCDIYGSAAAGNSLGEMLKLGSSKQWPDAMEVLTGQRIMDASGVLEYFAPIYEWIKAENEKNGEFIGWEESQVQYCTQDQKDDISSSGLLQTLNRLKGILN